MAAVAFTSGSPISTHEGKALDQDVAPIKKWLPRVIGRIARMALPHIGFEAKIRLADTILQDCGFGSGADLASSNEETVFELLPDENPVLVDVGAHIGEYTTRFLARFHEGRAYAFEPVQAHFNLLQQELPHQDRVELVQCAVSDFEGEAFAKQTRPRPFFHFI
jgi:hypothetical protein